jgi:uncharacterized membrane protein YkoI
MQESWAGRDDPMRIRFVTLAAAVAMAGTAPAAGAQSSRLVASSGGEVVSRMAARIPGVTAEQRARLRVGGDSAQRIALTDFGWRGKVVSLEIDEEDSRLYWDVKIEPDALPRAIVRYRVDATNGGILGIKEFGGARRRP